MPKVGECGGEWGKLCKGYRVSVFEGEKVLKMNGGDGCMTVYLMQPNCVPKNSLKWYIYIMYIFSSIQSLSCVQLFATPWTAARQASLSIAKSWSLLKLMSIESVMPSNHLILCRPRLLPPSILPSIRVFSND